MKYADRLGPAFSQFRRGFVVVFHIGRSGSSVLGDMIGRHPGVFWDGEVFRSHLERHRVAESGFTSAMLESVPPPDIAKLVRRSGPLIYGAELKFFHLDLFELDLVGYLDELQEHGLTHVIVLERRNYLAKVVSSVRAHTDGMYHRPADVERSEAPAPVNLAGPLHIDYSNRDLVGHLEGYRDGFETLRSALRSAGLTALELTYEDDVEQDPGVAYRSVCEHLGIRPVPIRPSLGRTGARNLREQLANPQHVEQILAGTEFAWMLNSDT